MKETIYENNPELALAFDYVMNTNKSVFLTGKAGTGKTTFLRKLRELSPKRMVIVAPTGVAAINAGGVTIHSLFQLPFSPHIPSEVGGVDIKKFNKEKIFLIKSMDLLVIDEISMVRCDVLDAIDEVCRKFRDKTKPFGGLQLLLIGDIHQLSPVAKEEEWSLLRPYYNNVYFFSSHALQKSFPIAIELKHIYRQSDERFIGLLNKVRNNELDTDALALLESRYQPNFKLNDAEGYITLTTHNAIAKNINASKLKNLQAPAFIFNAEIEGDFPEYIYPTETELELKVGAQVMFIKNDTSNYKQYYNGKIGVITEISELGITVKTDEYESIRVEKELWENIKYTLNSETKNIDEVVLGS
ncbi:MAG: AAA family ATPase, partial [Bacteroidetes bacterium]|nr:AAA family ATPase [Bacteroidota bacterium]